MFHREHTAKEHGANLQYVSVANVERLEREPSATVAIEAFANPRCVLTPKEIVGKSLPMDPDINHRFPERIFRVIDTNHDQGIVFVHLSQLRGEGKENLSRLPVETYGIVVLQALRAKNWSAT